MAGSPETPSEATDSTDTAAEGYAALEQDDNPSQETIDKDEAMAHVMDEPESERVALLARARNHLDAAARSKDPAFQRQRSKAADMLLDEADGQRRESDSRAEDAASAFDEQQEVRKRLDGAQ